MNKRPEPFRKKFSDLDKIGETSVETNLRSQIKE